MAGGRLFHAREAATGKAQCLYLPYVKKFVPIFHFCSQNLV